MYLDNIESIINNDPLLILTNINEYITKIKSIYNTIIDINKDPGKVIIMYKDIFEDLNDTVTYKNVSLYYLINNYSYIPYNQKNILLKLINGLNYTQKILLIEKIEVNTIIDLLFLYIQFGDQGENIIPYNDYNKLITSFNQFVFDYSNNEFAFNSNKYMLLFIEYYNVNKKINIENYNNLDDKYIMVKNAINYGYIYSDYLFINIDNVNYQ
jgi:hypothetical protein